MPSVQSIPLKQRTVIGISVTLAVASYFIPQPEQSYQSPLLRPTTAAPAQDARPGRHIKPAADATVIVEASSPAAVVPALGSDKFLATAPKPRGIMLAPDDSGLGRGTVETTVMPVPTGPAPSLPSAVVFSRDLFNGAATGAPAPESRFLPVSQQNPAK